MKTSNIKMEYQVNKNGISRDEILYISTVLGKSEDEVLEIMKSSEKENYLNQHKNRIWQNKNGRWLTFLPDTTDNGNRLRITANDLASLEDKIVDFYKSKNTVRDARTLTLRIMYPEWLEWKKSDVKPQTIDRINKDWERYYADASIVDVPFIHLTSDRLKKWVKSMIEKYEMGRHQFGNFSVILRQMMAYAHEEKLYIQFNPFDKVKIKWSKDLYIEEKKPEDKLVFLYDEQAAFIEYCWEQYRNGRHKKQIFTPLAIVFAFYTGLRLGELSALKFSDVHNNEIIIQRMCVYETREVSKRTKGGEMRRVPLTDKAAEIIEVVRDRRNELGLSDYGYIFPVDEPIKLYTRTQATLSTYCKELGMKTRSPHDIRRTFISDLLEANVNIKTVMDIAGQKQVSTTLNCYAYPVRRAKERADAVAQALPF